MEPFLPVTMANVRSLAGLTLENARARLEPLDHHHLDPLTGLLDHQNLTPYSPYALSSSTDMAAYLERALTDRAAGTRYAFAVYDKPAQAYAGATSYCTISPKDQSLEIGYTWLGRAFQGSGINTAIKLLMLEHAFERLGFYRIEFRIHSRNGRSRRAVEKIGGQFEGELREHMLLPDGTRRTSAYYSILAPEWPAVKQERFGK